MDPNQFDWQTYINFLQNYHMSPSTKKSQSCPSFLPPPPSNYFMPNTQTPSTVNSQSSQTFPSIPPNNPTMIQIMKLVRNFHNFLPKLG